MNEFAVSPLSILSIAGGLTYLFMGGDLLVRGSMAIARKLRVPSAIVGATIVALGTSLPELLVSILAVNRDAGGIAMGNVVGSNIANIGLILGVGALVGRIDIPDELLRRDIVWLLGATLAVGVLAIGGEYTRPEGALLLAGGVAFLVFSYRVARKEMAEGRM